MQILRPIIVTTHHNLVLDRLIQCLLLLPLQAREGLNVAWLDTLVAMTGCTLPPLFFIRGL